MRRLAVLPFLLCLSLAAAQVPQSPVQPAPTPASPAAPAQAGASLLSPQAAYDQASTPIDITRRSKSNWSEIEKAALAVAVDQAKDACLARASETYTGDDLISFARLCDLGQQWKIVYLAATTYINSTDAAKPQLEQAFAFEVVADLNMQQWSAAGSTCFAMLKSVPYGPLSDEVMSATIRYLQFAYLGNALDVSAQREPVLLALIRSSQAAATSPSAATPPPPSSPPSSDQPVVAPPVTPPPLPLHVLVRRALDFAALQLYNNQPERAAGIVADIDRAIPANVPSDETILMAADRRQYALIGTHFPDLPGAVSLFSPTALHSVNFGAVTVFMLFPPWCAQCIRQEHDMGAALLRNADGNVHMYGLLADEPPPPPKPETHLSPGGLSTAGAHHAGPPQAGHPAVPPDKPEAPKSAADQLRGTPTLVVAPSTLKDFNAGDFPFLIATDHDGIIRLMVSGAPENALVKDGPVDQIIDTIVAGWPPAGTHPAAAGSAVPVPGQGPAPAK